jgi:hypothetical protein
MLYRIKQAYISKSVAPFKNRWLKMFNVVEYNNVNEPAVFFYNTVKDLPSILNHKTKCVVVITSSHTVQLEKAAHALNKPNIKILATARISERLKEMGIKSYWPKQGILVEKVEPVRLGNMIYTYIPKPEIYGLETLQKINTKYEILIGGRPRINMDVWYNGECKNYYDKAFVGLNLSETSAGQTSIVDLGLRGIRCITNVIQMPHTIPWKTIKDIENAIDTEAEYIGTINSELAKQVYESMDYEQKWLEIEI